MEVSLYELQSGSNTNHSGNLGFRNLWSSRSGSQTLRQKGSDSQTERRGEERKNTGCGKREKEMRTEKKRMKMRSDKVTDGSPDSEHNDASLQRFKSQLSSR